MKKTPIYDGHVKLGAKIVDFHGWLMPIQYKGIVEEHRAVRSHAGIFDVSHMGVIDIRGKDAYDLVQFLTTNNLDKIGPGRAIYGALCNEDGKMLDDLISYMFSKEHILLVVNASNLETDFEWIKKHTGKFSVDAKNISDSLVLIALQGPDAPDIAEKLFKQSLASLKRFHFSEYTAGGVKILTARTGYTGEDGFELFVEAAKGEWLWNELLKLGAEPIGLGARDTLRLESGYLLYGNDADINTTPLEAGIGWALDLNKKGFIGQEALKIFKPKKKLFFMEMLESGIPRQGYKIFSNRKEIGVVTSGTFSPSLGKGIAMGYVDGEYGEVEIEIRGRMLKAKVKT